MKSAARPFTACPNGDERPGRGQAHDFVGFAPDEGTPAIFCARCGEIRALEVAPVEPALTDRSDDDGVLVERHR